MLSPSIQLPNSVPSILCRNRTMYLNTMRKWFTHAKYWIMQGRYSERMKRILVLNLMPWTVLLRKSKIKHASWYVFYLLMSYSFAYLHAVISVFIISICTPLQLNDVTDGLLSPCTSNELKAFCTQVRIYNDINTVVGKLTTSNPAHSDPCPWINDHFEGAVKQFLRQKMDC